VIGRNAIATEGEAGTTYSAGKEDSYIRVPPGSTNVSIGQDGSVSYTDNNPESATYQHRVTAGYLSLATFANESGLERLGGSLWGQTSNSGTPIVGTPDTRLRLDHRGVLEMSNVESGYGDDQHGHCRARLPGQLARDHNGLRNARDGGVDALGPAAGAAGRRCLQNCGKGGRASSKRTAPRSPGRDGALRRPPRG